MVTLEMIMIGLLVVFIILGALLVHLIEEDQK